MKLDNGMDYALLRIELRDEDGESLPLPCARCGEALLTGQILGLQIEANESGYDLNPVHVVCPDHHPDL